MPTLGNRGQISDLALQLVRSSRLLSPLRAAWRVYDRLLPAQGVGPRWVRSLLLFGLVALVVFLTSTTTAWASGMFETMGAASTWFGIAAVATAAYTGVAAILRWRVRSNRLLGLMAFSLGVYSVAVLCSYSGPAHEWKLLMIGLWPSVPMTLGFFARSSIAAVAVTRMSNVPSEPGWKRIIDIWRPHSARTIRFARIRFSRGELVLVWLPALVLSAVGVVPGMLFRVSAATGSVWHGRLVQPTPYFVVVLVWVGLVIALSMLLLEASWRTKSFGLNACALARTNAARFASWAAMGATAVSTANHIVHWWSEPMTDFALALIVFVYAMRVMDAEKYNTRTRAYVDIKHRSIVAVVGIVVSLAFATGFQSGPAMKAVYAALIAGVGALLAWAIATLRSDSAARVGLNAASVDRVALDEDDDDGVGLASPIGALLCGEREPALLDIDPVVASSLIAPLERLTDTAFIGIFSAMSTLTHPSASPRLSELPQGAAEFLDAWAIPDDDAPYVEKCQALARLAWKTVQRLPADVGDAKRLRDGDAPYSWIVSSFLRVRIDGRIDGVADDTPAAECYDWRLWMRKLPNKDDITPTSPHHTFAEIIAMSVDEQKQALDELDRAEHGGSTAARRRAMKALMPEVKAAWIDRLRAIVDEPAAAPSRD